MRRFTQAGLACTLACVLCSAAAAVPSMHLMVSQGHVIEVSDTRQATSKADGNIDGVWLSPDGKYLLYTLEDRPVVGRVGLVKLSGERPTVLVEGANLDTQKELLRTGGEAWICNGTGDDGPAWSSDSRFIAIQATHILLKAPTDDANLAARESPGYAPQPGEAMVETGILVVSSRGAGRSFYPLGKGMTWGGSVLWSPDCSRIALACSRYDASRPAGEQSTSMVCLLQRVNGVISELYTSTESSDIRLRGWTSDGKRLLCDVVKRGKPFETELPVDGSPAIQRDKPTNALPITSPNGAFRVMPGAGLTIEQPSTGRKILVSKSPDAKFLSWSTDGSLFTYGVTVSVKDGQDFRTETIRSLWIGAPEENKLNAMCVTHSASASRKGISWSSDSSRLAYISEGRAYVAEFSVREPDATEKSAANLPLTDQEISDLVMPAAKQIAVAIMMYSQDYDGGLPSADKALEALYPYIKSRDPFCRPGTGDPIFHFTGSGKLTDIKDPGGTVIGYMDAGGGTIVDIYADGHVRVRPR